MILSIQLYTIVIECFTLPDSAWRGPVQCQHLHSLHRLKKKPDLLKLLVLQCSFCYLQEWEKLLTVIKEPSSALE